MSFDRVKFSEIPDKVTATAETFRTRAMETVEKLPNPPLVEEKVMLERVPKKLVSAVMLAVVLAGVGTSYVLARFVAPAPVAQVEQAATPEEVENKIQVGAVFGVPDEETFRDDAEGVLIKGGIAGEGSHTLLRPGGKSQNVYLTSTVVDLDQFENMKVHVWGETFKAQRAGWLMDVGRLEVLELAAEKPSWYKE